MLQARFSQSRSQRAGQATLHPLLCVTALCLAQARQELFVVLQRNHSRPNFRARLLGRLAVLALDVLLSSGGQGTQERVIMHVTTWPSATHDQGQQKHGVDPHCHTHP